MPKAHTRPPAAFARFHPRMPRTCKYKLMKSATKGALRNNSYNLAFGLMR